MIKTKIISDQAPRTNTGAAPHLEVARIGIVSRDYRHKDNGFADFSAAFHGVLKDLDEECCDTVLFSPWSIDARNSARPSVRLRTIRSVLYETFTGNGKKRKGKEFVVYYRRDNRWLRHVLGGRCFGFGSLKGLPKWKVERFVQDVKRHRILGNCSVLICGESNGVKYSQKGRKVEDVFGLRRSLPRDTVVLNPVHDRMSRFEMPLKRAFLSKNGRWVISVWNRGKLDKGGRLWDGTKAPWTIFHNGQPVAVEPMLRKGLEVGILEIRGGRKAKPTRARNQ